jgi:hypothetical protein
MTLEFERLAGLPVDRLLMELGEYPYKPSSRLVDLRRTVGPAFADLLPHLAMLYHFAFPGKRRQLYDAVLKILRRALSVERAEQALRNALRSVWYADPLPQPEKLQYWLLLIANRATPERMVAELEGLPALLEEPAFEDEDYE